MLGTACTEPVVADGEAHTGEQVTALPPLFLSLVSHDRCFEGEEADFVFVYGLFGIFA